MTTSELVRSWHYTCFVGAVLQAPASPKIANTGAFSSACSLCFDTSWFLNPSFSSHLQTIAGRPSSHSLSWRLQSTNLLHLFAHWGSRSKWNDPRYHRASSDCYLNRGIRCYLKHYSLQSCHSFPCDRVTWYYLNSHGLLSFDWIDYFTMSPGFDLRNCWPWSKSCLLVFE